MHVTKFDPGALAPSRNWVFGTAVVFGACVVAGLPAGAQVIDVTTGGAASNVTGFSPSSGAEDPRFAIDDTTQKFLNFGTDGDQASPYTPAAILKIVPILGTGTGGTVVSAVRFYTANDAVARDPSNFTLLGSTDGVNYVAIATSGVTLPNTGADTGTQTNSNAGRNSAGQPIVTPGLYAATVNLTNTIPYTSYEISFNHVRDDVSANSVQIAEVELLGTVVTPEPGMGALLLSGVWAAGMRRRRR
jgi:hypothetical protein